MAPWLLALTTSPAHPPSPDPAPQFSPHRTRLQELNDLFGISADIKANDAHIFFEQTDQVLYAHFTQTPQAVGGAPCQQSFTDFAR